MTILLDFQCQSHSIFFCRVFLADSMLSKNFLVCWPSSIFSIKIVDTYLGFIFNIHIQLLADNLHFVLRKVETPLHSGLEFLSRIPSLASLRNNRPQMFRFRYLIKFMYVCFCLFRSALRSINSIVCILFFSANKTQMGGICGIAFAVMYTQ